MNDSAIRRLDPSEWELLKALRLAALRDAPSAFGSTYSREEAQSSDWWQTSLKTLHWMVVEVEGNPVSLCALHRDDNLPNASEIIAMWVDPRFRRQGLAKALVSYCEAHARSLGSTELSLAVAADNGAAKTLYEELGFLYYGRDDCLRSRPEMGAVRLTKLLQD